jgi:hypothetical protein
VALGVGPEFKPQYWKKKKINKKLIETSSHHYGKTYYKFEASFLKIEGRLRKTALFSIWKCVAYFGKHLYN